MHTVFYFSNGNDIEYLIASLRSLSANAGLSAPPIVFCSKPLDIAEPHKQVVLPNVELGLFDATVYGRDKFIAMCMRVAAIDWLRKNDYKSAIYLDTDTIVLRRMDRLESFLRSEGVIGAVDDLAYLSRSTIGMEAASGRIRPSVTVDDYFNSGVLAIRLDRLPPGSLVDELIDFIERNPAPAYPDQDFLNWYAHKYGLLTLLPDECNAIASLLPMVSTTTDRERNRLWFENEVEVAHYASIKPDFPQGSSRSFCDMALTYLPDGKVRDGVLKVASELHPLVK